MAVAEEMLADVRLHLEAMYNGSKATERRVADRYLQKLQRDASGWALADAILGGRTPLASLETFDSQPLAKEALIFAAMTLHVKVCGDLHSLSVEQQAHLRQVALGHLSRWGTTPKLHTVTKKVALAVAALAVQTGWEGVLSFVEGTLAEAEASADVGRACRARLMAIELLAALPEQCASRRLCVAAIKREAYGQFLKSASGGALGAMTSVAVATSEATRSAPEAVGSVATRLNARIFACLHSWMSWSFVHPDALAASPLFLGAFEALEHDELSDAAADVIVEALRTYDCSQPANVAIVSAVAPRIMGLRERFERTAASWSDDDDAVCLSRLFCEMGEAYMPLIASPQNANQMLCIVDLELCCARRVSRRVAGLALRFFQNLARAWTRFPEDERNAPAKTQLHSLLIEPIGQLVDICLAHARRTDDDGSAEDFARDEHSLSEEFVRHRQDVAETLGDCVNFLGADRVLEKVGADLGRASQDASNDGIEAGFFALRAIVEWVPDSEDRVLPHAMRLALQLPSEWRASLRAGAALAGAYATWIRVHAAEFLQPLFAFLIARLERTALDSSRRDGDRRREPASSRRRGSSGPSVAAKALKAVCSASRVHLATVPTVVDLRDRLAAVSLRDEHEVLEGLAMVVASSPDVDVLAEGFERLVELPAAALATVASQPEPADAAVVVDQLDRLTAVIRYTTPEGEVIRRDPKGRAHPVLSAVDRLWPVFEALAERYSSNATVIERLCRCYKHSMRSCRIAFEPLLDRMISHLVHHFVRAPRSSYIYATSICITEFGGKPSKSDVLFQMLQHISHAVFSLFQTIDDFRDKPDVAEEFFYLVSRFLDYCPDRLVEDELLASILRCGMVGLALEHREAQRGVLHCFERTFIVAIAAQQQRRVPYPTADSARRVFALRTLLVDQAFGRDVLGAVFKALTGELPAYALDDGHGSLVSVLWRIRTFAPGDFHRWAAHCLAALDHRLASNETKQDLLLAISSDPPDRPAFAEALLVFSAKCREIARLLRC